MDAKQLRPDPMDYQIIQCSNCLQMLSCICYIAAFIIPVLDDAAQIIDCIADAFTASVAGCMGAQLSAELSLPDNPPIVPMGGPSVSINDDGKDAKTEMEVMDRS